ncbi:MAG: putative cell wall binding repeat 2-containing protein [Frankiales bacterium]|nr:putative cell wall binding repeat 2-containing protein [Frankiales bacterium]
MHTTNPLKTRKTPFSDHPDTKDPQVTAPTALSTPSRRLLQLATTAAAASAALLAVASPASASTIVGSPTSYRLSTVQNPVLDRTEVVRWDPCTPIDFRINAALGGRQAKADVLTAVARLSAASGLQFRYLGSTSYVPTAGRAPLAGSPLVIAWAPPAGRPSGSSRIGAGEVGHGGWAASTSPAGHYRISSGYVVVRAGAPLAMGFGAGVTRGRVLMHELGHAVGLDHVADRTMVMNATVTPSSPTALYQAGDVAGLRRVGAPAGCIS